MGLVNPIDFMNLSGLVSLPEQAIAGLYSSYSLAWIPVYLKYHNNKQLEKFERQYSPFKSSRLGGNVSSQIENSIR
ncbi:protein of unknown function,might belong to Alginate lyase [Shewanella benthica]|uniref:Uncharacterized protein n=1 Tax=Shewanella benthica TaxID=43661 RepID=A0A330LZE2_9GAMM|nr:protein of unknown function,might belong to Alginate lyase [Shewanella benthica]